MFVLKAYDVLGGLTFSLRCLSRETGHDHLLWSGWCGQGAMDGLDKLELFRQAAQQALDAAIEGRMDELTDDCG